MAERMRKAKSLRCLKFCFWAACQIFNRCRPSNQHQACFFHSRASIKRNKILRNRNTYRFYQERSYEWKISPHSSTLHSSCRSTRFHSHCYICDSICKFSKLKLHCTEPEGEKYCTAQISTPSQILGIHCLPVILKL